MSLTRRAVHVAPAALLELSMLGSPAAAPTDDLAHCAVIAAPDARLMCYDALAGRPAEHALPLAATATATATAAAAATAGTSAATAIPATPGDPQNFGLAQVQVHQAPEGPASIQAHVAQVNDNGVTRASVVLDNGQTWTFTEASEDAQLRPGDLVSVRRATLGSFLLVTPAKHSYHVRRTR